MSPFIEKNGNANANDATNTLPRKLQQCETDWKTHTKENPLKIGVPGRTSFENSVKFEHGVNQMRTSTPVSAFNFSLSC